VTGNSASGQGGGVFHEGDPLLEAGFRSTIIAANTASGVADDCDTDGNGLFTSNGFNLDSTDTCGLGAGTDLPNVTALLGPLADNGGPTWTHRLLVGSPAIDAGSTDPLGPDIDQRGVVRPQGVRRDIGAFERSGAVPSTCASADAAVADWKGEVPVAECADLREAQKLCKAWLKTCKKVVKAAASCRSAEVSSAASLEKAACKISSVGDPRQCKKDAAAEFKLLKADAKTQRAAGFDACEDHLDDCILLCND
jgi:hypothetical protein